MADFVKFRFDNIFYDKPMSFPPFNIVQVGDIDTYSGFKCTKHIQVAHEITYIVRGNGTMLCDDKTHFCKTGDIIFNPKVLQVNSGAKKWASSTALPLPKLLKI